MFIGSGRSWGEWRGWGEATSTVRGLRFRESKEKASPFQPSVPRCCLGDQCRPPSTSPRCGLEACHTQWHSCPYPRALLIFSTARLPSPSVRPSGSGQTSTERRNPTLSSPALLSYSRDQAHTPPPSLSNALCGAESYPPQDVSTNCPSTKRRTRQRYSAGGRVEALSRQLHVTTAGVREAWSTVSPCIVQHCGIDIYLECRAVDNCVLATRNSLSR